jgi:hypothetical protein
MPAIWFYPGTPGFINLTPGIYMPFFLSKSFTEVLSSNKSQMMQIVAEFPRQRWKKKFNFIKEN